MRKRIKGYEDYEITRDGRVISYKFNTPRELTPWAQASGYLNIGLSRKGIKKNFLIHRLVAQAFVPNPDNLPEVNHIDHDKANNNVDNLEWCTRYDNLAHSAVGFHRNEHKCKLVSVSGDFTKDFPNIKTAADWASKNLDCSKSYLRKSGAVSNGYTIKRTCRD